MYRNFQNLAAPQPCQLSDITKALDLLPLLLDSVVNNGDSKLLSNGLLHPLHKSSITFTLLNSIILESRSMICNWTYERSLLENSQRCADTYSKDWYSGQGNRKWDAACITWAYACDTPLLDEGAATLWLQG